MIFISKQSHNNPASSKLPLINSRGGINGEEKGNDGPHLQLVQMGTYPLTSVETGWFTSVGDLALRQSLTLASPMQDSSLGCHRLEWQVQGPVVPKPTKRHFGLTSACFSLSPLPQVMSRIRHCAPLCSPSSLCLRAQNRDGESSFCVYHVQPGQNLVLSLPKQSSLELLGYIKFLTCLNVYTVTAFICLFSHLQKKIVK